ncbi:hypothetical protein HYX18_04540 [Candidatus Woesearchaeota archaeon]|nr:hypothetical protein [Candidatus Woesearchaeota archaeon]
MVSITLSVPKEVKQKMKRFPEMNWSGFIRKVIIEKTEELTWKEGMLKRFYEEEKLTDWAVKLQRRARKGRFNILRKKGLV